MKKFWNLILATPFVLAACHTNTERGVTIEGEISGLDAGELVSCVRPAADHESKMAEMITTNVDDKGRFTLHIPVKAGQADWYMIWAGASQEPARTTRLYLDSGVVSISGKGGFADATYHGNSDMEAYNTFLTGLEETRSTERNNMATGLEMASAVGSFICHWVAAHPASPLGTALLERYKSSGYLHVDSAVRYFKQMKVEALNNLPAHRLEKWVEETTDIMPGKVAPVFAESDTLGKPVSLKDFRGKYVLLDFWASWCGPCRAENPNVVKAYEAYKDKGFTVLGVSLDQSGGKDAWLKAIHHDGLTWTHVSDLQYFDNAAAKLYHIQAIPSNFLIGPDGVIVARNLRGEALETELAKLLGNQAETE